MYNNYDPNHQNENKEEEFSFTFSGEPQPEYPQGDNGKRPGSKKKAAAVISIGLLLALALGFGGGYVAKLWLSEEGGIQTTSESGKDKDKVVENWQVETSSSPESSIPSDDGFADIEPDHDTSAPSGSSGHMVATAEGGRTSALSTTAIVEKTASSVVEIRTETVTGGGRLSQFVSEGAGSGVIITEDGYIVTNNHVVSGASKITVLLNNGETYEAALIGSDSKTDLAVVKIEASGLNAAVLGDSDQLKVGDYVVAIGNPLGTLGGTVTDGIVSALQRSVTIDGEDMTLLQTNAAINPGNSGGGLFDQYGQLIAVVNAKSSGTGIEGLGFAIPINTAIPVINDIMSQGFVSGRPSTGMTFANTSTTYFGFMYYASVYITDVPEGSNAEASGFKEGDYVMQVNGETVSTVSDINAVINGCEAGDTVEITVIRGSRYGTLSLVLEETTSNIN